MDPLTLGAVLAIVTIAVLFSGVSVAVGLLIVSAGFLLIFDGARSLELLPEIFFGKLDNFALLSIPMFIIMGASIASTRAGADLYEALERWLTRVPGGLVISNLVRLRVVRRHVGLIACHVRSHRQDGHPRNAEKRGIPGHGRHRLHRSRWHAWYPDPAVGHHDRLRHRHRNLHRPAVPGRRHSPVPAAGGAVHGLVVIQTPGAAGRPKPGCAGRDAHTLCGQAGSASCRGCLPFIAIILGVLWSPCMAAMPRHRKRRPWVRCSAWWWQSSSIKSVEPEDPAVACAARLDPRKRDDPVHHRRCRGVLLHAVFSLFITQSIAAWIGTLDVNRWVLMFAINIFLLIAGFFLPPVAVILMAAPILLPIVTNAGFDPYWFAVILTINMEIGLISPPVGLNLYVINGIAPEISLRTILVGSLPFVACMVLAIILLCLFPGLATWLPDTLMGPAV
jgi:C4-dicarboxylate transporter DctM subunit